MSHSNPDITSIEDIRQLVDTFYEKVRFNELLGPVFAGVIGKHWPQHLEKMYRFWQTVLLGEHTYSGSPFPPHASLPVEPLHFDTWLQLWQETVDTCFSGEKAGEAKWRAAKMAVMFLSKIGYYRDNNGIPLL